MRVEEIGYLDFDLRLEPTGAGHRARVLNSPAGQAASDFILPFSDLELENFILRMSRPGRKTRRLGAPEFEAARAFGGRLFEALFTGEVRGCLRSSLDAADREGRGLRLRLHLADAPELANVPWEYLYSPALNRFFALSNATPLVRYLDLPGRIAPLAVQPPLRLLAVIASPKDYPSLDADGEWERLRSALKELQDAGLLALERLEPPTLSALQRRLRAGPCHILHFIGHGAFDDAAQDGLLVLEDQNGGGRVISGQDLGVLLHDHHPMRLVVLNSCEGARTSRTDPFAGTAQSLIQQGMPAVLAMQFEISDQAAVVLSHEFYAALAAGYPVDAALAEARKAVFTGASGAEWGTPVLHLCAADGRIFGIASQPPASQVERLAPATANVRVEPASTPVPTRSRVPSRALLLATAGALAAAAAIFGVLRFAPAGQRPPAASTPQASISLPAREKTTTAAVEATSRPAVPATQTALTAKTATVQPAVAHLDKLIATQPSVLSSSKRVYDVISAGDGVWAATTGGLVRWRPDGESALFTTAEGLPFNHLRAILPIQDGVLWTASNGAVSRITLRGDQIEVIENFTAEDGVDFGESPVMMRDADGSIWLASAYTDNPIVRFDGSLWRAPELPRDDPALTGVRPQIGSMLRGKDGALWLGLWEDGILQLKDGAWRRYGKEQGVPEEAIARLLEDGNGAMWAAAGDSGLLRFDAEGGQWERVEFQREDARIVDISEMPDGRLWASGNNFILESRDGGKSWKTAASSGDGLDYPRRVVQDDAGRLWMGSDRGVVEYADGRWQSLVRAEELAWHAAASIKVAPNGKLWVLPEYGGPPSVVDPATGRAAPPDWPGALPDVITLAFADDATWAGMDGRLLRIEDGAVETWEVSDGLPGYRVNVLLATTDTLWIGGSEGLARLDLASGNITGKVDSVAGQFVSALALAPDRALWAATHWGNDGENSAIYRFGDGETRAWTNKEAPLNRPHVRANALAADEAGGIWVASDNGVFRWDGVRWQGWASAQGAPSSEVFSFLARDGAMWMAGHSGLIDRWDARGWRNFRPKGLTGDALAMTMSEDGSLWIGTGDGLLRYTPK